MSSLSNKIKIVCLTTVVMSGCRPSPKQTDYSEDEKQTGVIAYGGGSGGSGKSLINIPVSVEYGLFGLLGTAASAHSVDLTGCLSAYTATVTQANLDGIEVYKDDRNCLAKLKAFTFGGIVYNTVNAGAVDFTTWLANDTAIFAGPSSEIIRVKVVSQLNSPITGTEAVVYNFAELLDGTGDILFSEASVSDPHAITVESQEAPHFNVIGATFLGMDDITGAAEFTFKLECVNDPTLGSPTSIAMVDGSQTNSLCSQNDLANVSYKLIKDTFSSTLTITQAETIFSTAGTGVTMPADQYADSATNEGFNTVTLDGPGGLGVAGNENMILILKGGISYTYFNIDVTTISQ